MSASKLTAAVLFLASVFALAACATENSQPTPTPRVPTLTRPAATATNTRTPTPSITPTPTLSPTPTQTPLPTGTPPLPPGATQVSPQDGMLLVYVPAGKFTMGSQSDAPGADYDELPPHTVYLDAFWIYKTTVTNAMYADFLNAMGNQVEGRATWLDAASPDALLYQHPSGGWQPRAGYEDYPVVEVTWYGANAYCQWIGLRLPTEAEWEKAARDADERRFPWGDEIDCEHAQYGNCRGGLQPVGSKPAGASPYGVLDMAGNVWEWVADWYADDYYANSPARNPQGPESGLTRVLRGGSWDYNWKHQLSADRRHNGPSVAKYDYGFRCAADGGYGLTRR